MCRRDWGVCESEKYVLIFIVIILLCFILVLVQVVDTVEEAVDYILKKESSS
jgi:hypothetical protein